MFAQSAANREELADDRQGGQRSTPPFRGPGPGGSPARNRPSSPRRAETNWVPTYQRPAVA